MMKEQRMWLKAPLTVSIDTVSVHLEKNWLHFRDKIRIASFQDSPCQILMTIARDQHVPFQTTTSSFDNPFLVHITCIKHLLRLYSQIIPHSLSI